VVGNRWAYVKIASSAPNGCAAWRCATASKSTGQRSHIGMAGVAFLIGAAGIVLAALVAESSMTAEQHIMLLE